MIDGLCDEDMTRLYQNLMVHRSKPNNRTDSLSKHPLLALYKYTTTHHPPESTPVVWKKNL